jgi:hypothetical protein
MRLMRKNLRKANAGAEIEAEIEAEEAHEARLKTIEEKVGQTRTRESQRRDVLPSSPAEILSDPAALAERARCRAILRSAAATGRLQFAIHLACDSNCSAEIAIGILAVAPLETKRSRLDGCVPQPNVSAMPPVGHAAADGWDAAIQQVNAELIKATGVR